MYEYINEINAYRAYEKHSDEWKVWNSWNLNKGDIFKMINYANKKVKYEGCPGCAFAKHEFDLPCGIAYENERFTLAQDWELPIEGFMIVSPKRHIEKLSELSRGERIEMFDIVDRTIKILRENGVCENFDVIFEERADRHLHVWMMEICEDIIDNVKVVCDYAKENFRNDEVYERISEVSEMVREEFEKREK